MATAVKSKSRKKNQNTQPKVHTYEWTGYSKDGRKSSGEFRGTSVMEVRSQLKLQGVSPKSVRKKSPPLFKSDKKITAMDIAMVTRQIATMLAAGVPLVTTIELLGKGHEKPKMRMLLGTIVSEVQSGSPLSEALRPHRRYFDDLYVDLVAAGEHSGSLEQVFDRIATYKEKAEALKSKIKKAMFYPAAVVVVAIGVTSLLLLMVVPQFEEIFRGFGAELPAFTQFIIGISKWLQAWWYVIFGGLAVGIWLFKRAHNNSQLVRDRVDEAVLKAPIVGDILHKA
ncbi:MAG: type II secretion system F family protein, partial [Shewanella sp.]|nr:type II secretion system F family protein [Shewanella sp.]